MLKTLSTIIMKKLSLLLAFILCVFAVKAQKAEQQLDQLMTSWHKAAAKADFNAYFGLLHEKSIYMGTDATERWTKPEFISFAKPYFDRGTAWNFTAVDRHISFSKDGNTAWVDEILDTKNMSLCRGSGVLIKENGKWKIIQYVLSMTVPNNLANDVTKIKTPEEGKVLKDFQSKK